MTKKVGQCVRWSFSGVPALRRPPRLTHFGQFPCDARLLARGDRVNLIKTCQEIFNQ